MNEDRKRILDMLAEGKINADEAAMLLDQMEVPKAAVPAQVYRPDMDMEPTAPGGEKMLRVRVLSTERGQKTPTHVNVNFPLKAARIAGRIINTMMPNAAKQAMLDEGIDIAELDLVGLIDALEETGGDIVNITQDDEDEQVIVRVYIG